MPICLYIASCMRVLKMEHFRHPHAFSYRFLQTKRVLYRNVIKLKIAVSHTNPQRYILTNSTLPGSHILLCGEDIHRTR